MGKLYAKVIISITHKDVDREFTYKIPMGRENMAVPGMRVLAPFGRNNKPCEGYIMEVFMDPSGETLGMDPSKIKEIQSFPDNTPMFDAHLLELARWMKEKYYTTMSEALGCIMPAGVKIRNNSLYTLGDGESNKVISKSKQEIVDYITDRDSPVALRELSDEFGDSVISKLNALVKDGILLKEDRLISRDYNQKIKYVSLNDSGNEENLEIRTQINAVAAQDSKQGLVVRFLLERGQTALSDLKKALGISDSPIRTLEKKSIVIIESVTIRRVTAKGTADDGERPTLTKEQELALAHIKDCLARDENTRPILIRGITGSGKTEVYLKLIEQTIAQGRQAIMLVPEISLTPQTVERFYARFGSQVAVTHSRLSNGERYDQWKNAAEGAISVMIGPRSAVFTPFPHLGIIVIDEEHENTYKSETTPKYDTRLAAVKRGALAKALVVMGSATPSLESFYKAQIGEYELIHMNDRVNSSLPTVEIIDMREELAQGNRSIFSDALRQGLKENMDKGEQSILFLNRRGHSTFVSCRKCGYVLKCEDCNINYTYHLYTDKLLCHYCGQEAKNPKNCPQCGSTFIKYFGVGTQRIEDEVKSLFPAAKVLRMDMDTTSRKNSHETILSQFRQGQAQILIGTQMIAKGLDFPNVTLVGVVAADLSLNSGDYRAGETTFQLLTQVSGRAGRADLLGKVIIQTYNPTHYAICYAKDQDYLSFYDHEIALRQQMNYPPFTHIFAILFTGEREREIIVALFKLLDIMNYYNKKGDFELLGPAPAQISKIRKRYRWKLIVKCADEVRLRNFVLYCVEKLKSVEDLTDMNVNLTIDPAVNV